MMRTSPEGVAFLVSHEGVVPAPYRDSVGVLTYGIGHTAAAGAPDPASLPRGMPADLDAALEDVFEVFRRDLARYEDAVRRAIKVPVAQHEFDAAVSFHFNTGAIWRATWVESLNAGQRERAAEQITNWRKPAAIIPRREAEQALFRGKGYGHSTATIWGVQGERVVWRPIRTLTQADVVRMLGRTKPAPRPTIAPPAPAPDYSNPPGRALGIMALLGAAIAGLAFWRKKKDD